jgi:hypothetical protein
MRRWSEQLGVYVECESVWNGRGAMPHEASDAMFFAQRETPYRRQDTRRYYAESASKAAPKRKTVLRAKCRGCGKRKPVAALTPGLRLCVVCRGGRPFTIAA